MKRIPKHAGGKSHPAPPDVGERKPSGKGGGSPPGLPGRRPYQSPSLIRYGTLEELTEAGGRSGQTADPSSVNP
jgi:hypothetical protein